MTTPQCTATSLKPRWRPQHLQIDPSDGYAYYQILDKAGNPLAKIVATKGADPITDPSGSGMAGKTEYWKIKHTLTELKTSGYDSLSVWKVRSGDWGKIAPPPFKAVDASFSTGVDASWGGSSGTASCHQSSSSDYGGFAVEISNAGGQWRGTMNFYRMKGDLVFKSIGDGAIEVFTRSNYSYKESCKIDLL